VALVDWSFHNLYNIFALRTTPQALSFSEVKSTHSNCARLDACGIIIIIIIVTIIKANVPARLCPPPPQQAHRPRMPPPHPNPPRMSTAPMACCTSHPMPGARGAVGRSAVGGGWQAKFENRVYQPWGASVCADIPCKSPAKGKAHNTGSGYFENATADLLILRCNPNKLLSLKFLQQMRRQQGRHCLLHVVAFVAAKQPM
jgi:hypothetical protein